MLAESKYLNTALLTPFQSISYVANKHIFAISIIIQFYDRLLYQFTMPSDIVLQGQLLRDPTGMSCLNILIISTDAVSKYIQIIQFHWINDNCSGMNEIGVYV